MSASKYGVSGVNSEHRTPGPAGRIRSLPTAAQADGLRRARGRSRRALPSNRRVHDEACGLPPSAVEVAMYIPWIVGVVLIILLIAYLL
jgi:hypothetical protein